MSQENVLQMPSRMQRLAIGINDCLKRDAANREEWIEIQIDLCTKLSEARGEHAGNIEFGRWCEESGFGEDVINPHTRAAAVAMGREPEALRKCLEATERRSLHTMYSFDFGRFANVYKTPSRKNELSYARPSPQIDKAKAAYDQLVAEGKRPSRDAVSKVAGVHQNTAQMAILARRAEIALDPFDPLDPADMADAMRKRYDLAVCRATRELRETITAEVRAEITAEFDTYVKRVNEKAKRADRIIASHKGVMSREMFRKIRACLHPDHNTFTHASEAMQAFSSLEAVLVKPEAPAIDAPPLPKTAMDLMAQRRRR